MDISPVGTSADHHPSWERIVLAAYRRMQGALQKTVAAEVGRTIRTIQLWEADTPLWEAARKEASKRWLTETIDASRRTLLRTIEGGDGELALKVLERTVAELVPPAQQHRHSGEVDVTMHVQAARDRLTTKLQVIADRQEGVA